MPEIGKDMENITGALKTDFYAPCAAHSECFIENINAAATNIIKATLPRVVVGKCQVLLGRNVVDGKGSKYLFNFLYGTYIPTNTEILFKFSGKKMKKYVDATKGDYQNVRLPASLSDLNYEIDRATTNVGSSIVATKYNTDITLPGVTNPMKHDIEYLLVKGLFKSGMNFDAALGQYLTLTVEGF